MQTKTSDEEHPKPKRGFIKSIIKTIRNKSDRDDVLTDLESKRLEEARKTPDSEYRWL